MNTWLIGRSEGADIRLEDETVSREHAELVQTGPQAFVLLDQGSSGGTWRLRDNVWEQVLRARVSMEDTVRLGECVSTVAELLALRRPQAPGRVERNPQTGEIVRKNR